MKRYILCMAAMLGLASAAFAQNNYNLAKRPKATQVLCQKDIETQRSHQAVQGAAVYGDLLFSLRNSGLCVVINLKHKSLVSEFRMASYGKLNHANVAFFGPERYDPSDRFPLLYVSQCKDGAVTEIGLPATDTLSRACFVERVITDEDGIPTGTQLVQVINVKFDHWNSHLFEFDSCNPQYLYVFGNVVGNAKPGNHIELNCLPFPAFDRDKFVVNMGQKDVLWSFYLDELLPEGVRGPQSNILQGGKVHDGLFYMPVGVGEKDYPSDIFVFDLAYGTDRTVRRACWYDYNDVIPHELEDMDIWGDRIICVTNSDGRVRPVYSFKLSAFKPVAW